jgi:hypothetical protein
VSDGQPTALTTLRTYRFGDSTRPGLLLGLGARQAVPVIGGVLWLAFVLQVGLPAPIGALGPVAGAGLAFGRWRGTPLAETLVPGLRLLARRRSRHRRWVRPLSLVGDHTGSALPRPLRGLELLDRDGHAVIHDRDAGTLTTVVRLAAQGFALASPGEQDVLLAGWGSALSPFARERCPVARIVWQDWAHPVGSDAHNAFLHEVGAHSRAADAATADYLGLVTAQAPLTIAHDVLVSVTVDQQLVRSRRSGSRLDTALDALRDETRLFISRLDAAGLTVDGPLPPFEVSTAIRLRSDPGRAAQVTSVARSLAAAARRSPLEWGPLAVEADWSHVRVDSAYHRTFRIAGWPQLPVGADWLSGLLIDTNCSRAVTVILEPVPMSRAARAADREVMSREADAAMRAEKGFRVNARERKRLAAVEARERELAEGHAEFSFVGLVTVTGADVDELDDHCADVEQAAAQSLLDLRPLDARHELGWVAALPLGRNLTPRRYGP